jgi:hypothetical protein
MHPFLRLLLLIFAFTQSSTIAQSSSNYIFEQQLFTAADKAYANGNYSLALRYCNQAYDSFTYIPARHCIKALSIAGLLNNENGITQWLKKCLEAGIPEWVLRKTAALQPIWKIRAVDSIIQEKEEYYRNYRLGIDTALADTINQMFAADQKATNLVNDGYWLWKPWYYLKWRWLNKKHAKIIKRMSLEGGFPGERRVGLSPIWTDTIKNKTILAIYGPDIEDVRAYFMLIHYYSDRRENPGELWLNQVKQGFLPAQHYAAICDFIAEFGNKANRNSHFNQWHADKSPERRNQINLRRQTIGLPPYEDHIQHRAEINAAQKLKSQVMHVWE